MAKIAQQMRDLVGCYHEMLCENLLLLDAFYPFPNDLRNVLSDKMFMRPNQAAFSQVSHYLALLIDPDGCKELIWPLRDKKMEANYRRQFYSFITKVASGEESIVAPIMPSQLVNASGYKVLKLFYQLSLVAMKKTIEANVRNQNLEYIDTLRRIKTGSIQLSSLQEVVRTCSNSVIEKAIRLRCFKSKASSTVRLYQEKLPIIEQKLKDRSDMLSSIVEDAIVASRIEDPSALREMEDLKDVNKKSVFLSKWQECLDKRFETTETVHRDKVERILATAKECKQFTDLIVNRYLNKDKETYCLTFNPTKDTVSVPASFIKELPSQQQSILANIVKNGKLHLPNLLTAYTIAIRHVFKSFRGVNFIDDYTESVEKHNDALCEVKNELAELLSEAKAFHNKLSEVAPVSSSSNLKMFYDEFEFPAMPSLAFSSDSLKKESHNTVNSYTPVTLHRIQFAVDKTARLDNFKILRSRTLDSLPKSRQRWQLHQKSMANFTRNMMEVKQNMQVIKKPAFDRTFKDVTFASLRLNPTMQARDASKSARQHLAKFLGKNTSAHKINERSFIGDRRKWKQLFSNSPEKTNLQKCRSSPNLFVPNTTKNTERFKKANRVLNLDDRDVGYDVLEVSNDLQVSYETPVQLRVPTMVELNGNCNNATPKQNEKLNIPTKSTTSSVEKLIARFKELTHNRIKMASKELPSLKPITPVFNVTHAETKLSDMTLDFLSDIHVNFNDKDDDSHGLNVASSDKQMRFTIPDLLHGPNRRIPGPSGENTVATDNVEFKTPDLSKLDDIFSPDSDVSPKGRPSLGNVLGVDLTFLDNFSKENDLDI